MDRDDLIVIGWRAISWAGLIAAASLLLALIVADHHVRRYYLATKNIGSAFGVVCVYEDSPWEPDTPAFCSVDPQKALDFAAKANEELRKAAR